MTCILLGFFTVLESWINTLILDAAWKEVTLNDHRPRNVPTLPELVTHVCRQRRELDPHMLWIARATTSQITGNSHDRNQSALSPTFTETAYSLKTVVILSAHKKSLLGLGAETLWDNILFIALQIRAMNFFTLEMTPALFLVRLCLHLSPIKSWVSSSFLRVCF